MPTLAKLFAAIGFALVGYFSAEAVKPFMPQGTQFGLFSELTALIGVICGWLIMGGLTGKGYVQAASGGIRVAVTIAFWALIGFSTYEMILRSMKMRYDGPMEAVLGIFELMMDYGRYLAHTEVIATLGIGGILAGLACEFAARRWS